MTFAIENYINQIAKTLFSQKKLLLSFVKNQNNTQINKFAEQYQAELDKLKTINEEFYSKQDEKLIESESKNSNNGTNSDQINQLKSQMAIVKSELTYLKSKKESTENLKERVEMLEQTYTIFKKNQDFCSDFQFNEFLSVYNSTMECTRESIRMNHEDIMKLKAITHHLQQKPDIDSISNSVRCLKHEIKLLKQSPLQQTGNSNILLPSNLQNDLSKLKKDLKNLSDLVNSHISKNESNQNSDQIKEQKVKQVNSNLQSDLEKQINEFKQLKTSIGCIKHEMRNLKVQVEDNVTIASQVDTLFDKYKKLKEKMKLENSSPNSPKRNGSSYDEESTKQIRNDLQVLKQNFVETFSMQNSSIANQSDQIKALRKSIDEINNIKTDKSINERLKIIETKLQIITSLAGSS